MPSYSRISDFLLTGCAIAPMAALWAGLPVFALFSHIVLLFAGVALAGCDGEAPFRNPDRFSSGRKR